MEFRGSKSRFRVHLFELSVLLDELALQLPRQYRLKGSGFRVEGFKDQGLGFRV